MNFIVVTPAENKSFVSPLGTIDFIEVELKQPTRTARERKCLTMSKRLDKNIHILDNS